CKSIVIGPNHHVSTTNEQAKLEYVEYKGQALKAGADDVKELEDRMENLGQKPMVEKTANATATSQIVSAKQATCDTQVWAQALQCALNAAFQLAARWQ